MLVQVCHLAKGALVEFLFDLGYFLVLKVDEDCEEASLTVFESESVQRVSDAIAR
jgi:hypothetical protein